MLRLRLSALLVLLAFGVSGCGARTATIDDAFEAGAHAVPHDEVCNGLDDDLDGTVDEDFRDDQGRYVNDDNCGRCGNPCRPTAPHEVAASCAVIEQTAVCAATACDPGFTPSTTGQCVPAWDCLCLTCADGGDCGDFPAARCALVGGEQRCSIACGDGTGGPGCPDGYACTDGLCIPTGGSCSCNPGDNFSIACAIATPMDPHCVGSAACTDGMLSACVAPAEVCDGTDDDCDGMVDEGYRDARGAYSLDIHNCGQCGVDCTQSTIPEGDLVCGGDPFAPTCVLHCPDTDNGIQPGDRVDANLNIADGCECTVTSVDDVPGPVGASGGTLDVNCDGADGVVVRSFYVAGDGNDSGPGSPTHPLATIGEAVRQAAASLGTDMPRPDIYIASGRYTESVTVPDGVRLHGGYRRDFLSLQPDGFRVDIRAPSDTTAPGGAALVVDGAGSTDTVVEWLAVTGVDATTPSAPAFGVFLRDPGPRLSLRQMEVRSGTAGSGMAGMAGVAGTAPPTAAGSVGDPPRAAVESSRHDCLPGAMNAVAGGAGGQNRCGSSDVSGGQGGSPACPSFSMVQPSGRTGSGRCSAGRRGRYRRPGLGGAHRRGGVHRRLGLLWPRRLHGAHRLHGAPVGSAGRRRDRGSSR